MSPGEPLFRLDWVLEHLDSLAQRIGEHMLVTVIAVAAGFVISFALALAVRRYPPLYGPILAISGVLYAIPSIALFVLFIPITGLSLLTAEIALVSYTLVILVRNIVTGLRGVPPEVIEAARGMGYTDQQRLWRVEIPIAMPIIVAGLRIATVTTIGLVTITAIIGLGGAGQLIYQGLILNFHTPLVVGTVLSVALAFVADGALLIAQRLTVPWSRTA